MFSIKCMLFFFLEREREGASVSKGKRQRKRESHKRQRERKGEREEWGSRKAGFVLTVCGTWTHEPWYHDLSQSRMPNHLSYPGTLNYILFIYQTLQGEKGQLIWVLWIKKGKGKNGTNSLTPLLPSLVLKKYFLWSGYPLQKSAGSMWWSCIGYFRASILEHFTSSYRHSWGSQLGLKASSKG